MTSSILVKREKKEIQYSKWWCAWCLKDKQQVVVMYEVNQQVVALYEIKSYYLPCP